MIQIRRVIASILGKDEEAVHTEEIHRVGEVWNSFDEVTQTVLCLRCGQEICPFAKTIEETSMITGISIKEIRKIEVPAMRRIEESLKPKARMKVLVLDDMEANVHHAIRYYWQGPEMVGETVQTVAEALAAVEKHQPDAILLDIELEKCANEGAEVARILRDRGWRGIIISHSTLAVKEQKRIMRPAGVEHHMDKGSPNFRWCLTGECICHKI